MNPRIIGLLLAGGESRRMKTNRLALPWQGVTVLAHVAAELKASAVDRLFILLGPTSQPLALSVQHLGNVIQIAQTPDMRATLQAGLAALTKQESLTNEDGILVALGDQPTITRADHEKVIASYRARPGLIHVAIHQGERAHPILVPWRIMTQLDRLPPDQVLNALLATSNVVEVELANQGVLEDLDLPEDYKRLSDSSS